MQLSSIDNRPLMVNTRCYSFFCIFKLCAMVGKELK